jgi:tetratricopeptide (TPR) repeat protein
VQAVADVDRTLARVDAQLHDTGAASNALLAALKLTPEQTDDTFLAAQLAEDQNNYAGAEQEYKKAVAAEPKSIPAAEGLARALIHQGKFADAEPVIQQGLQQEPNNPVLLAASATALAGLGKTQDAIAQLETLHKQNPNQPAVTRMLADLYSTGDHAADADPLYRQLLSNDSRDPDLLTAAGENFMREQKWSQAVQTFQQSLNLRPQQGNAWSDLAFAASENQQYPLVLTALNHRAQFLPDVPATLFLRATALDHLHRTKEALPYYKKFLSEAQGRFPDEESQTRDRLVQLRDSR